jgi:hypothetical protein
MASDEMDSAKPLEDDPPEELKPLSAFPPAGDNSVAQCIGTQVDLAAAVMLSKVNVTD